MLRLTLLLLLLLLLFEALETLIIIWAISVTKLMKLNILNPSFGFIVQDALASFE